MIPILYEKDEVAFASNGLGRLRDCISCVVTEERNGIYECDFEYPIDGVNYDRIKLGRIIAVEHDETNDVQPFDIVSYSRPINGVVTFHAVHISYRQTALTVSGTGINSLADAFTLLGDSTPDNPFSYWTDKDSTGYLASADNVPHSVRQILGGMEGSVLDAYGGEYEWDKWQVKLWASRGELKNFTIRYGVNLVDYEEEMDYADTYNAVVPFWNNGEVVVKGGMVQTNAPTFNDTVRCIPLDLTDKFETQPTVAQLEATGLSYMQTNQTYLPAQSIKIDFVRITDSNEYEQFKSLQTCKLCDSINVVFSKYNMSGQFKIVRTEYDVLQERYQAMELGTLSVTLAEALGINQDSAKHTTADYVVDEGTSGSWTYRKWNNGTLECWYSGNPGAYTCGTARGNMYSGGWITYGFPIPFISAPTVTASATLTTDAYVVLAQVSSIGASSCRVRITAGSSIASNSNYAITIHAIGKWE